MQDVASKFKIRASAINSILSASGKFIQGNQTYCKNWIKEQLYNRKKEFYSKYTEKGTEVELEAMGYLHSITGLELDHKTEFMENEFLTGTCDALTDDTVIEVKSSWDCFTFPLFEDQPEQKYIDQVQGYMELYDKPRALISYVLVSTPDHIVEREAWNWARKQGMEELDADIFEEFRASMNYDNIPDELRIKTFEIERDRGFIKEIEQRVLICREYIRNLLSDFG